MNQLDPHTVTVVPSEAMTIDLPANGSMVSQAFTIAGWAIDVAAPTGTGVDLVQATAHPIGGGAPIALGTAAYGGNRPDVGTAYGDARFAPSGFSLSSASLLAGTYRIDVHARSTVTGAFFTESTTVTVGTDPRMVLEVPAHGATVGNPFVIGGWAIDLANPTAAGVEALHIYAYPHAGGSPILIGVVGITGQRPDVAAAYGARYLVSGYGKAATRTRWCSIH